MAVAVRHQLVGLLGRGIEADRMVDVVRLGERQLLVAPIDARTRGIDQMAHAGLPAAFEDIDETKQVAVGIGQRIL